MYLNFFGFKEKPFSVTSDPSFLYLSKKHRETIAHMHYGIAERMGFIEITGDIGTGKTTVCKALLSGLDEHTKTAFIINPNFSAVELLQAIAEDLGIKLKNNKRITILNELNRFLLEQLKNNNNTVLIIDEAQNLKLSLLEQVRLLSNLETGKEKLLQIILVGQPELKDKLASPELTQLRQRITIRYHITPLDKSEVSGYINHRVKVAGVNSMDFFDDGAIEEIFRFSGGVPRLINIICDKTLLAAYTQEKKIVNADIVKKSAKEIEGIFE